MKFEILKRSHLKRNIIVGIATVSIIGACILTFTRAKYRTTESIPLVNGTINYTPYDFKVIAMYQENNNGEYSEIEEMPSSGYIINEKKSYCTLDNVNKETNITLKTIDGYHTFSGLQKNSKCYLYFDEQKILLTSTIMEGKEIKTRNLPLMRSSKVEGDTTGTIYKSKDNDGDTYYFAGAPTDNWVKFAGFYWRIIRINGDGSIRMIYNGTSTNVTGIGTQIQESAFNTDYNRSEHVGYMYTINQQHGNTTDSSIKDVLDSWYSSNLASYADKISTEAGFCGDREMSSGYSWSSEPSSTIYYAGYGRLAQNSSSVNPTFKCSNSNDLYTTSSSSKGNKALVNPIGLITADEVVMAGLPITGTGISATSNYIYAENDYWTMTPCYYASGAAPFYVHSNGVLSTYNAVSTAFGVRPVINLSADVIIKSGNGTSSTPYEI